MQKDWVWRVHFFNRKILSLLSKICVSIFIFWILFSRIELSDVLEALLKTDIFFILFAILLTFMGILLGVYRWKLSLTVKKIHVSFMMILNATLISRFIGLIFPAFIGADAIRGYDLYKQIKEGDNIFASILFERICGLVSLVVIGSCALLFSMGQTENLSLIKPYILVYLVLFFVIISCFSKVITTLAISFFEITPRFKWVRDKIENLSEAIYMYRGYHKLWISVMSLSMLYQFQGILFYYLIGLSLSLEIPLITFSVLIPIINLVTMIPISPGGLGVKEGMFVILFNQYGVAPAEALSISLIGTSLYLISVLIGSIVYFTRPKALSTNPHM